MQKGKNYTPAPIRCPDPERKKEATHNYVAILGLIALIIALFNIKGDAQLRAKLLLAILLSIFALTIVFLQFWRLFAPHAIPPNGSA
jgi:uncharacterized YccA/Bax inhibitor family protein